MVAGMGRWCRNGNHIAAQITGDYWTRWTRRLRESTGAWATTEIR